jgi:hypothetical protein
MKMIALLAAVLLQGAPDPEATCVDLVTFDIQNSELHRAIVVEGSIINRTPWPLTNVAIEIVIIGDNKFPLGTMPRQSIPTIAPRKGAAISLKGVSVPAATRFTHRITIRYTVEAQERTQVYENLVMKSTKIYVDPEAGPKVGVMGYFVVPGAYKTAGKAQAYSGDTLFLRVRVDGFDDKIKPEGSLDVTISGDGRKLAPVHRSISAASLKLDFSKLPGTDADPKIICYDDVRKDLYVGLQRVEDIRKLGKITLDVKFSGKGGTWTWPAIEEPHLEALRPPDKK